MSATRTMAVTALGFVLFGHSAQAQDRLRYRDFPLGSSVAVCACTLAGKLGVADQAVPFHVSAVSSDCVPFEPPATSTCAVPALPEGNSVAV